MGHTIKKKTKLSLVKSIKFIVKSKYLLHLAIIVIGCGLTINMIEVTWKANLKTSLSRSCRLSKFYGNGCFKCWIFCPHYYSIFWRNGLKAFRMAFLVLELHPFLLELPDFFFSSLAIFKIQSTHSPRSLASHHFYLLFSLEHFKMS